VQSKPAERDPRDSTWWTAALPSFGLLGISLPLIFAGLFERYLYYLRPAELLPTYAVSWLALATLTIPVVLAAKLVLKATEAVRPLAIARLPLTITLKGTFAGAAAAAIVAGSLVWIRFFGFLGDVHLGGNLTWVLLLAGVILAATRRGRWHIRRLSTLAAWATALGALTLLSLPFFRWPAASSEDLATAASAGTVGRPNILLLTFDALSAPHMSLYAAARPTTPMLLELARSATTFERAYANANFTTSGISSILTGTRPWTNRATLLPSWPLDSALRDSLPAVLHAAGYLTGYVGTNPVAGAAKNGFGAYFDFASHDRFKGFSLCSDRLSSLSRYVCAADENPLLLEFDRLISLAYGVHDNSQYEPRLATSAALSWLRRAPRTKPIFLWVHLYPPHSPYAAPRPWLGRFDPSAAARTSADSEPEWMFFASKVPQARRRVLEARYEESIAYVDRDAGEFLQQAMRMLGDDTAVIVSSDHGESFSHGYGAHTGPALYEDLIHIPLIVKLPGQRASVRSSVIAEQIDIAPTLAAIAHVPPPADWEGDSLLSAARGDESASTMGERDSFSMNFEENHRRAALTRGSVAVIQGDWKLIHYLGALHYTLMPELHDELYDLAGDPGERANIAGEHPQEVTHLLGLIDEQLARHGGPLN
jgi:arylsulfatase A-like enzyme